MTVWSRWSCPPFGHRSRRTCNSVHDDALITKRPFLIRRPRNTTDRQYVAYDITDGPLTYTATPNLRWKPDTLGGDIWIAYRMAICSYTNSVFPANFMPLHMLTGCDVPFVRGYAHLDFNMWRTCAKMSIQKGFSPLNQRKFQNQDGL